MNKNDGSTKIGPVNPASGLKCATPHPAPGSLHLNHRADADGIYTAYRPIGCEVLLCILSEVPATNGAAQKIVYQPNSKCQWKHFKNTLQNNTTGRMLHSVTVSGVSLKTVSL